MKTLTTSLIAALSLPAAADIFTLKDGSKIDATILEKTLEKYELEVNITKSIKERRTIKRDDVVSHERVRVNQADAIFKEKIAGLAPAPPFLELADYDSRVKVIKAFLEEHKVTTAGTKAAPMLSELERERALIAAGGIKTSMEPAGLISAEDRKKDSIGIAAGKEATKFKNLVAKRSYLAALRQYSILEESYLGTQPHREALPLMSRLVNSYAALLTNELASAENREERRTATLAQLSDSDRRRAIQAEEQRLATLAAIWEAEEEENQRWNTVDPQSVDSLEGTIKELENERDRLVNVSEEIAGIGDLAQLYREGWLAAGEKKQEELETILDSMEAAGATEAQINVLIDRFDPTINNPPAEEESEGEAGEEEAGEDETGEDQAAEDEATKDQDKSDISE